jgi:biopolymer transport protein ExbB
LTGVTVADGGSLAHWFAIGGVTMWALLAVAVAGLAVAIERTLALSRARIDLNDFLGRVRKALITNRSPREAIKICERFRGPTPSIVKAGLLKYGQPRDDVEATLQNAALFEQGRLERLLPLLRTLGAVAPLLGLLGSTAGIIRTLGTLAESGGPELADVMRAMKGPLVPTVAGLSIGILLRLAHGWLASRAARVERDIETASNMLLETFGEMERGNGGASTAASEAAVPSR